MQDSFADFSRDALVAQKKYESLGNQLLLLQKQWTRKDNLGPAFTLAEFARLWCIPERTLRHYAKHSPLPGGIQVGKRLKIRRTRESFEFGKSLLAKQQKRQADNFARTYAAFLNLAIGAMVITERDLYLQSAHAQNLPKTEDIGGDVVDIISKRIAAFEGLETPTPKSVLVKIEKKCPDDPFAKMTEAERYVRKKHRGVFAWVSVAAALNQSGVRPTRARIAERMGMSRATFTRKFPEARWSVIKAAVSDWMNNAQPIQSTGRKNRKRMI